MEPLLSFDDASTLSPNDQSPLERYLEQSQSSTITLQDCFDSQGNLLYDRFTELTVLEEQSDKLEREAFEFLREEEDQPLPRPLKRNRGSRKGRAQSLKPYYFDENGNRVELLPTQTFWYLVYVRNPPTQDPNFQSKFRRRFRLPHEEFPRLVNRLRASGMFSRWLGKDCVGKPSSPIQLLALGSLRYLGRGLTFDDLEEYTAIHEETHRQFMHVFIKYGSTILFDEFVRYPVNAEEYKPHQIEFDNGGLHGAGYSTDATNVIMWRCSASLKQAHMGFKNSHPARTCNLTCNHRRRILHTTKGHPSRWNDKTLAWLDTFMLGVREGKLLQDVQFELLSWSGTPHKSETESTRYRGAWGLVDNGYHRWSCTQAPGKNDLLLTEIRLSEWIESFRKDSECVFGTLKGRWRILKTGIRLEGEEAADNVWLTCCALHNLLLEVDGLDQGWDKGVRSTDWEGALGDNDPEEMRRHAPFAIRRLENPAQFGSRQHENDCALPRVAHGVDDTVGDDEASVGSNGRGNTTDDEGAVFVNALSYTDFRERLIIHFDILYSQRRVVWPQRIITTNN